MPPKSAAVNQANKQTVNVKVNVNTAKPVAKKPRKKRGDDPPPVPSGVPPPPPVFVAPVYAPNQSAFVPQGVAAPAFDTAATNHQMFRDLQANNVAQLQMIQDLQQAFESRMAPVGVRDTTAQTAVAVQPDTRSAASEVFESDNSLYTLTHPANDSASDGESMQGSAKTPSVEDTPEAKTALPVMTANPLHNASAYHELGNIPEDLELKKFPSKKLLTPGSVGEGSGSTYTQIMPRRGPVTRSQARSSSGRPHSRTRSRVYSQPPRADE
jgi:hypothetical protein